MHMQMVSARPPGLKRFPFFVHDVSDVHISRKIRQRGVWEPFETQILLALLGGGDQVIDIGANIGWYTVAAAQRVGSKGHIFAFEPDRRNFEILMANIRQNKLMCVSADRMALGRAPGTAAIRSSTDNQGDVRVREFAPSVAVNLDNEKVAVGTLDDYLADSRHFDLSRLRVLKMDVQGFEHEVLLGAGRLLTSLPERTVCFIEFDPVLLADQSDLACRGFIDAIAALSRRILMICRPIWSLREITVDDLRSADTLAPNACYDLIVTHESTLQDLNSALPLIPRLLSSWAPKRL